MKETNIKSLKNWVWAYFLLLIFEGALRKWVLPGLSQPLLLVRDPIALLLIFQTIKLGIWKPNNYVIIMWLLTTLAFIFALIFGHGNILVAVYGFRITAFHFPLLFIIGTLFDKNDVLIIGKAMLWLTVVMTILVGVQFYSPQTAWVNRGIGGDTHGSGFSAAGDYFRVPGTFSFTNGLSLFYGFAAPFVFYFIVNVAEIKVPRYLLWGATVALIAAIPLTVSRTVLFEVVVSAAFTIIVSGTNAKQIKTLFGGAVAVAFLVLALNTFSFFKTATDVFDRRIENATQSEGALNSVFIDRFLGGMYSAVTSENNSFLGMGLGMGTNAGAKLMTGSTGFLISEGEWGRLVGEMGFLIGLLLIIIRFSIVVEFLRDGWQSSRLNNTLPWMIMSFAFINILQGQWAQPTALGFSIVAGGCTMAAFKTKL